MSDLITINTWNEIFESMGIASIQKKSSKEIAVVLESDFDSLFNEKNLIKHQSSNLDKTLNALKTRIESRYNYIKNTTKYSSNYIMAELYVQEEHEKKAQDMLNSFDSGRTQILKQYITHRQIPERQEDKEDLAKYISALVMLRGAKRCEQLLLEKQSRLNTL